MSNNSEKRVTFVERLVNIFNLHCDEERGYVCIGFGILVALLCALAIRGTDDNIGLFYAVIGGLIFFGILFILGIINIFGYAIAKCIVASKDKIKKNKDFYVVTYTGVTKAKLCDFELASDNSVVFQCRLDGDTTLSNVNPKELYHTESEANKAYQEVKGKQFVSVYEMLGMENADKFLNSDLFLKYAEMYYKQRARVFCMYEQHPCTLNFLTNRDSVLDFFRFIDWNVQMDKREIESRVKLEEENEKAIKTILTITEDDGFSAST